MQPCLVGLLIAAPALAQDAAPRDEAAESRVGRCRLEYGACGVGECRQATIETGNASAEHCTTYLHRGHRRSVCRSTVAGAHARARHVRAVDRDVPQQSHSAGRHGRYVQARHGGTHPDTTGLERDPQPGRIQTTALAISQPRHDRLEDHCRQGSNASNTRHFLPASKRTSASSAAFMLGVWGIESAFGDPVVEKNHMRPVIPSLAAWPGPNRAGVPTGRVNSSMR